MAPALPPGPREPAVLQTLEWVMRPTAFLRRCAATYGEAFTVRLAFDDAPLVLVWHPDAVRAVYSASASVARRGGSPGPLRPVAGPRSILLADGDEHLRIRRLMLPAFHGEHVATYAAVVSEVTAEHLARWPRDESVAALPIMQDLTLAVILRAVFGTDDPRLAADIRATLAVATSLPRAAAMSLVQRDLGPASPWGAFMRRMAVVDEQLMALIARRRAEGGDRGDVLGQLIAAGLEDAELRDHLVTLLAAGHETTSGSLAWAVERLARAPDVLAHLRDGDEAWIDAVVKETLRVRPVLTVAPRKLAAPLRVDGHELPAGVHVAPCIYLVHRREDLYPDAHLWRPERWLGQEPAESFAWIPFGGGLRRCVGAAFATMEMAVVLRLVAASLRLSPAAARGERMRRRGLTLQPDRGARVVFSDASRASS
ncbi:MAG TPA: cytochrome P450 [Solirubrobacteraceae bacterium]